MLNLEDIAWHFIADRIDTLGGMILQKELYEKIYEEGLHPDEYQKEDIWIEFGKTSETMDWVGIIIATFDVNVLLREAYELLEILNEALVSPIGSDLFEKGRGLIQNTVLLEAVKKIEIIPGKGVMTIYYPPEEEKKISMIKNFLQTL